MKLGYRRDHSSVHYWLKLYAWESMGKNGSPAESMLESTVGREFIQNLGCRFTEMSS